MDRVSRAEDLLPSAEDRVHDAEDRFASGGDLVFLEDDPSWFDEDLCFRGEDLRPSPEDLSRSYPGLRSCEEVRFSPSAVPCRPPQVLVSCMEDNCPWAKVLGSRANDLCSRANDLGLEKKLVSASSEAGCK